MSMRRRIETKHPTIAAGSDPESVPLIEKNISDKMPGREKTQILSMPAERSWSDRRMQNSFPRMLTDESDVEKTLKQEHEAGTFCREPGISYIKSTVTPPP